MARLRFSELTTEEVRGALREAQLVASTGGQYISGGAADVSWAKYREIHVNVLVKDLMDELCKRGDDDRYPSSDISIEQTKPDFS